MSAGCAHVLEIMKTHEIARFMTHRYLIRLMKLNFIFNISVDLIRFFVALKKNEWRCIEVRIDVEVDLKFPAVFAIAMLIAHAQPHASMTVSFPFCHLFVNSNWILLNNYCALHFWALLENPAWTALNYLRNTSKWGKRFMYNYIRVIEFHAYTNKTFSW